MAKSLFRDKEQLPNRAALQGALGDTAPLWDALWQHVRGTYAGAATTWTHYGNAYGWAYVVKDRKLRTLCYLTPTEAGATATFILGEGAVATTRGADLPPWVHDAIEAAAPARQGRTVDLPLQGEDALAAAEALLAIKTKN